MSQTSIAPSAFHADISRIDKYAPAELIGRETETELLSDAWGKAVRGDTNRPRVLTFVALGGEGKTSLVAKWAAALAHQDWAGCNSAFAWSFYSQGTRNQTAASSDLFLADALTFFGDPAMSQSSQSAFDKGRRLAQLIGERRVLLILDGVEPLQYAPTSPTPGELKDSGLAALLKGLAANNHGLCVVTTRYSIPDLNAYRDKTAPEIKLPRLSNDAGVSLLKLLGVKGVQTEYETLVEDVKGHALTMNLLGSYLVEAHARDIRKRDLVKLEDADEEQGGHAFRVMDAYVHWFATGGKKAKDNRKGQRSIAILRLLGLFDRPATADSITALLKAPAIPYLTEPFTSITEVQRNISFSRLEAAKLITIDRDAGGKLLSLDAHPVIREYFSRQLAVHHPEARRAASKRLFEFLTTNTKEGKRPTLKELQPLFEAVSHGCQAGILKEALHTVYFDRLHRGEEFYSIKKLGSFGADLGAVACFFEQPWSKVSATLEPSAQASLFNAAAICLRALGRLTEALEPMRAGLKTGLHAANAAATEQEKLYALRAASTLGSNLSDLQLTLGMVTQALTDANEAVTNAASSRDVFQQIARHAVYADVLHQAGHRIEAAERFEEAEVLQAKYQPNSPLLYAVRGFRYCDLLLAITERSAWQVMLQITTVESKSAGYLPSAPQIQRCYEVAKRAAQTLHWGEDQFNLGPLDIAVDYLTLGRTALYKTVIASESYDYLSSCNAHLQRAVDGLRLSGEKTRLPNALLTRAWLRNLNRTNTGAESAQGDLDEAWEIAERGPMPLILADIHLHRARLFGPLAKGASGEPYPWESPAADLAAARKLIEKHGYWRRKEELVCQHVSFET